MAGGGPSFSDIYDVGLAALQSRRPRLIVLPGDVTDAYLMGGATMASVIIGSGARGFRITYIDGAEGDDLTVRCRDGSVERDTGDAAIGTITYTRPTVGAAGVIPKGSKIATDPDPVTGAFPTYTTDVDLAFLSTDLSLSVSATCTTTGKLGNVDVGFVTRQLSNLFDSSFVVTNANRMAGGAEVESDPDLRDRTKAYPQTLAKGTINALVYGAKQVPGVKRASVIVDPGTGIISLFVSDADGNSNPAMAAAVALAFQNDWRGAGDILQVISAVLVLANVSLKITVKTGVDVNTLITKIIAAVTAEIAKLNPGDTLFKDAIQTAAKNVDPTKIASVAVLLPLVDTVPASGQIFRAGTVGVS